MRVIVNPRAGRGSVRDEWPEVARIIEEAELAFEVVFTEDAGHAVDLARDAVAEGCRFVVAVGGDGTINEVVNGLMGEDEPLDPELVLGVVPAGSGSDFARTFGLPQRPGDAARHLAGKTVWGELDIGRIRYRDAAGAERRRWFVNVAEAGIGAQVVHDAARMPRWLGGRAYRLGALKAIAGYRSQEATVVLNGRRARGVRRDAPFEEVRFAGAITMLVVANGQFFGGGLRVAPRAIPSDAMLDVLIGHGSKWEAVKALQRMPRGEHVPDATIDELLADRIRIDGPEPIPVEADGELLGSTPATVDLRAAAIKLKI